jgi:hypothetical protein
MDQIELYKGYRIRTRQQESGGWFADIQKQDGSDFLLIVEPDGTPQRFLAITRVMGTAEAAIKLAKEAIDRGDQRKAGRAARLPEADCSDPYTLEKWTKDGAKVDGVLYAGNNLDKARELFQQAIKHRPRIRLTIRQRTRVLEQWPQ